MLASVKINIVGFIMLASQNQSKSELRFTEIVCSVAFKISSLAGHPDLVSLSLGSVLLLVDQQRYVIGPKVFCPQNIFLQFSLAGIVNIRTALVRTAPNQLQNPPCHLCEGNNMYKASRFWRPYFTSSHVSWNVSEGGPFLWLKSVLAIDYFLAVCPFKGAICSNFCCHWWTSRACSCQLRNTSNLSELTGPSLNKAHLLSTASDLDLSILWKKWGNLLLILQCWPEFIYLYGSVSAGRGKWAITGLFFEKIEALLWLNS